MSKLKFVLLSALFCLLGNQLFAHALWIETAAAGKIGQEQTIRVFYGEYASNERDSVAKWYSDVKEFTLWLVGPDQKKTQLILSPGINYFESKFKPEQNGAYTILVSHEAKELGGSTKYHFLSSACVTVGHSLPVLTGNSNALKLHLDDLNALKLNKSLKIKAFLQDAAAQGKTVSVFSPNGWTKELTTNEQGIAEFIPFWAGRYVIEVSDTDKTPGQHYGKDYKSTWKGATYSFEVK